MNKFRHRWIRLIAFGAAFLPALALSAGKPFSDHVTVSLTKKNPNVHLIDGKFKVDAPASIVWDVLSDYNGIASFVSSIRSSRIVRREGDRIFVDQQASGRIFLLTKRIKLMLAVKELRPKLISFEDVSHTTFRSYSGSWEVSDVDGKTAVSYKIAAVPNFFAPDFIANGGFRKNAVQLLEQVKEEIERRTKKNSAASQ